MTTPRHCPGFEALKNISSVTFKCPGCSAENEIFSDEFDRKHFCKTCKKEIDFTKCKPDAVA